MLLHFFFLNKEQREKKKNVPALLRVIHIENRKISYIDFEH